MKKIYLLAFTILSTATYAQTIVQGDLPFSGLAWTSGVDTNYADPVPPGGASQNWDFSTLQYSYIDTSGFQDAAGTPYASTFPGANLASHKVSTDEWSYFISSSTGFYVNGFATPASAFVLNPPQMYIPVPFSYGDMHTDISRIVIDTTFSTYAAQIIINFHADFHADGYGSLITPTATYPNTLRVKQTMLETDSLMVDYLGNGNYILLGSQQSQKTYYRWYQHAGTANYILGIDADSLGVMATGSDYVMQWAVLGIPVTEENTLAVFPNPASNQITITGVNGLTTIEFYNMPGQKVYRSDGEQLHLQNGELKLDVTDWEPGVYFYHAVSGQKEFRGKFCIAD